MNPDARACSRIKGPDCRYRAASTWPWCGNLTLAVIIAGDITDCPYYEPETKFDRWHMYVLGALMIIEGIWIGAMLC